MGRGRPSRIEQLGGEIQDTVDRLLRGGTSQREILRALEPLCAAAGAAPISRSGLNRYSQQMEELGKKIRETRAVADAWVAQLGEEPTGQVSELIVEMLRTAVFQIAAHLQAGEDIDPDDVGRLALAVQRLEKASEISLRREQKIRDEFAAATSAAVDAEAKRRGVSPEVAQALRSVVEGRA